MEELGVMPYRQWHFIKEVESPEWQEKLHAPKHGSPGGLYGSHGPTDLINVSASLALLACGEPVRNVTAIGA